MSSPPRDRGGSRARLSEYYGITQHHQENVPVPAGVGHSNERGKGVIKKGPTQHQSNSPYDINGTGFDPDIFVARLVKEASLSQLMAQEGEVIRQIQVCMQNTGKRLEGALLFIYREAPFLWFCNSKYLSTTAVEYRWENYMGPTCTPI